MAVYAVGDIQGCYDPLMRLLDHVRFEPAKDKLWIAGDLVNRGRQSLETLRFVRSLGDAAVCILGNHDVSLLSAFHGLRKLHKSLRKLADAPDFAELVEWLAHRPLLHLDENLGYVMTHAGIPPAWDLATAVACAHELEQALRQPDPSSWLAEVFGDQPDAWSAAHTELDRHRYSLNALTRMRYCRADGSLEFTAKDSPEHLNKHAQLVPWFDYPARQPVGCTILFGHWSTLGYYVGNQVIALDTGCVWGGWLSAVRVDTHNPEQISIKCSEYG